MSHVAIIGAGVVGLACASALCRRGHAVTLVDPRGPGEHCSFGNAGCFSRASCVPLGLPGSWKKVPGWLLDPMAPLAIRWRYAHRIAPWLWRFHRASSRANVERIADSLHALLTVTLERWRPLAEWAGVPELIQQRGYAFAYESDAAYAADALGRRLRRERGVRIDVLEGAEVRAYEPALSPGVHRLVVLPEQGHCPNPFRLSQALASRLAEDGARFVSGTVAGFDIDGSRVRCLRTSAGPVSADHVVLAAGAHSRHLAAMLGARVPLETERGYHVTIAAPGIELRAPIMSGEMKFFATPMEGGLRIAGTVELAGLDAPPDYRRADALLAGAKMLFPGLDTRGGVERWMGHRPSLPDSLPVIGRSQGLDNAFFAFGHGHVGLTAAAPTADIVADLIDGHPPWLDISPFSAARFGR